MKPRTVQPFFSQEPSEQQILGWIGSKATDEFGSSVGKIADVYAVEGKLEWLLIRQKRNRHVLAPVRNAVGSAKSVFLPFTSELIESAPQIDPGTEATPEILRTVREHYGVKA